MSWILFSILAALTWAVVNTVDKYILTKWVRNPIVPVMILGVVGLIASILVYIFHGFYYLSIQNIVLALIVGVLFVLICFFYFKAVKLEEVSRVIPLFYLSPLFVLIFAAISLGEIFTPIKYLGILLLLIGAVLISSKNFRLKPGKAFWLMLLVALLLAIQVTMGKYLLNFADYWTIFAYIRIGAMLAVIPMFYFYLPDLRATVKKHGKRVTAVISMNESLNLVGALFILIAMSTGFVTLTNALASTQPLFVLLIVVVLSIFYPKILKEEIDKSTLLLKVIAIVLMFAGIILIT